MESSLPMLAAFSTGAAVSAGLFMLRQFRARNFSQTSKPIKRIGILTAMAEELAKIKEHATDQKETKINPFLTIYEGRLGSTEVVFCQSGVGMVFASSCATTLVREFNITHLIFSGVAGGIRPGQNIGDVVIGSDLINYDMNCKAFKLPNYEHKLGELPFLGLREFKCDESLIKLAMQAPMSPDISYRQGRIVSGSEFLCENRKKELSSTWSEVGSPDAVEMEGAAVAQICIANQVPFLVLRAISDTIDGGSSDFQKFVQQAADNLWPMVEYIVKKV